jgi:hypothetical protein
VVVLAAVAVAGRAAGTTQPGRVYVSRLVIRDDAVMVRIRRDTWAASIRYRRGAEVRYDVTNRGTRPYNLNILGSTTGLLRPGGRTSMLVAWTRRGRFVFRVTPRGARLRVVVE